MKKLTAIAICLLIILTGCFMLPVEDPVLPIPIAPVAEAHMFRTIPVMRGDVVRDLNPMATHIPSGEERHIFDISGLFFRGIYVSAGDYVQEGDVLASLYNPDIQSRLQAATRREEWLQLSLTQVGQRQAATRRIAAASGTAMDNAPYNQERTRLQGDLNLLEDELEFLQRENSRLYLHASISGTVTQVIPFAAGLVSAEGVSVATIAGHSLPVFRISHAEAAPVMDVGDYFPLTIGDEVYLAVVIDPVEWNLNPGREQDVFLAFAEEAPELPPRPRASVHVFIAEERDVLFIPIRAVQRIDDRAFVFTLDANGVRAIRDIEVGLRGNTSYEVINGLLEGELVIID
ncbi:MAG: hypothetical protein FWE42_01185 [Defluviitaleaceae bacterium]|nr:hypothetical protein [Defluviitaleaceae bacterium]